MSLYQECEALQVAVLQQNPAPGWSSFDTRQLVSERWEVSENPIVIQAGALPRIQLKSLWDAAIYRDSFVV